MATVEFFTLAKSCSISRAIVSNMCSPLSNGTVSALQNEKEYYNTSTVDSSGPNWSDCHLLVFREARLFRRVA
jgi:hypothetical protein